LSAHGASVRVLDVRRADQLVPADLYLIASSIVDCTLERELGTEPSVVSDPGWVTSALLPRLWPEFYDGAADFIVKGRSRTSPRRWRA